jgi:hypothetical protein
MISSNNKFHRLLSFSSAYGNIRPVKFYLLALVLALVALPAAAEDWKTTDGTTYQSVKVIRVEDDAITIIYKDGGALIPLYKLPAALQERFDYDPVKAKIAAERRAKEDAENARAMQDEIAKADEIKRQKQIEIARQLGNTNSASGQ